MTQHFPDDPQAIPGGKVIRKGFVRAYDSGTHTATVHIVGSHPTVLTGVRVATDIPEDDVIIGRECTLMFLDPITQTDAVVITIQGALPSGGGGGHTTFIAHSDTPGAYTAKALQTLRVNAGETAVEFHDPYAAAHTWAALQTFGAGIKLAAAQAVKDSGGTDRYKPAASSPHNTLSGDTKLDGLVGIRSSPTANTYLNISPGTQTLTASTNFIVVNPSTNTIGANNINAFAVYGAPAFYIGNGNTGIGLAGLNFGTICAFGSAASALSYLYGAQAAWGSVLFAGTITEAAALVANNPYAVGTPASFPVAYGLKVKNQGVTGLTTAVGVDIEEQLLATNRIGIRVADISGGTQARILELGPATPYMRLEGSGEWPAAASTSPLLITVNNGANVLRRVEIGAANSAGAGYRYLRVLN